MKNRKYIKVSVSDRLPEVNKCVKVVDQEDNIYDGFITDKQVWQVYTQFEYGTIAHWLLEVPDYEEEMKEMLDKCKEKLEFLNNPYKGSANSLISELKELLTKLKQ